MGMDREDGYAHEGQSGPETGDERQGGDSLVDAQADQCSHQGLHPHRGDTLPQ